VEAVVKTRDSCGLPPNFERLSVVFVFESKARQRRTSII
jgi:hypothetical protein